MDLVDKNHGKRAYDRASDLLGGATAWLVYLMATITVIVVIMRYILGEGSIALQESISYLHAALFMLGASYALKRGAHVRVDVFYIRLSPAGQAWVDCLGTLVFLLPMSIFISWVSLDYVAASWHIGESSPDPGGLAFVYLLKTLIPIMGICLVIEAISQLLGNTRRLLNVLGNSHG
jgi:TRAP-type mannitol/chloroaromatic compound transport system permease small subunit